MPDPYVWVQTIAAVVTAFSAMGLVGLMWKGVRLLLDHDRALYGDDRNDGWDGVVTEAQRAHERIDEYHE